MKISRPPKENSSLKASGNPKNIRISPKSKRKTGLKSISLRKKQKGLQKQLGLTGMTMRQLEKNQKSLRAQMKQFVPNTPEWDKLNRELKETDRRLNSVRKEMGQTAGVMGRMKKTFGGFGSLFLGGVSIWRRHAGR